MPKSGQRGGKEAPQPPGGYNQRCTCPLNTASTRGCSRRLFSASGSCNYGSPRTRCACIVNIWSRVEARSLSGVGDFVAANYRDDWGDDRAQMVTRLRLVSRLLTSLTISANDVQTQVAGQTGTWRARLQVAAQGEAAAEIIERVNSLTTPFLLRWQRESWKPWDWQLVEISNPELQIPRGDF